MLWFTSVDGGLLDHFPTSGDRPMSICFSTADARVPQPFFSLPTTAPI